MAAIWFNDDVMETGISPLAFAAWMSIVSAASRHSREGRITRAGIDDALRPWRLSVETVRDLVRAGLLVPEPDGWYSLTGEGRYWSFSPPERTDEED